MVTLCAHRKLIEVRWGKTCVVPRLLLVSVCLVPVRHVPSNAKGRKTQMKFVFVCVSTFFLWSCISFDCAHKIRQAHEADDRKLHVVFVVCMGFFSAHFLVRCHKRICVEHNKQTHKHARARVFSDQSIATFYILLHFICVLGTMCPPHEMATAQTTRIFKCVQTFNLTQSSVEKCQKFFEPIDFIMFPILWSVVLFNGWQHVSKEIRMFLFLRFVFSFLFFRSFWFGSFRLDEAFLFIYSY